MRRTRHGWSAGFVPVAALALTLTACTGGGGSSSSGTSDGDKDVLTLGMTTDIAGWDPSIQPAFQSWAHEAVWDQLVMCNAVGELEPGLADEWEFSDDNSAVTAHIRSGITFSDGSELDTQDVADSFQYYAENGNRTADYEGLQIDIQDAETITLTWPEPQPIMANKLCDLKIAPSEWLAAGNFDAPVGSGPYVYDAKGSTTGSVYAFTKNENYWDADRYPYPKLEMRVITSTTAAVSALKTGQIDATIIGEADVPEVEGSGFEVEKYRGQTTRLIIGDRTGSVVPALGDVRVRQAMNMVFDKQAMADNLYNGNAEPTAQVFREGSAAYIDDLEDPYPYDIDKAKELMAEAGYADGFTLQIPTLEGQNHETLMPYVTQQLAEINIDVEQVPLSGANQFDDLLSGTYPVIVFQLGNLGNSAFQIYIEDTTEGWWNVVPTPDEFVEQHWEQIKTADQETSAELQKEINQYIVDEAWFAPMVYIGSNYAYDADKVSFGSQSDIEALSPKLRDFK